MTDTTVAPVTTQPPANTPVKVDPVLDSQHEITVNGKKVKVSVKDALANYQLKSAADEKFRDATSTAERAEQALSKIKDPAQLEAVLKELGANPDEIIDALAAKRAERKRQMEDESKLTPEQKELLQFRREKAERDAAKKDEDDKKKAREEEIKYNTTITLISNSIKSALKEFGMPENPENVGRVARALQELKKTDEGIVQGKVKLGKLLEKMKNQGKNTFEWVTQGYDPSRILDYIPEDKREALLVEYLKRKGSKKATSNTREDLSGGSPAEKQIRRGMRFIA